ncbi:transposase [Beggiatoa sp. PS]|nr:transposase [Beggiatoa sp. PS]
MTSKGKVAAQKLTKAHILLKADQSEGQSAWSDKKISEALQVSRPTIERVRKTFVEDGIETTLNRKKHCRCGHQKFDGEKEAHLIALACSEPPPFDIRWTAQLLADKMVELNHFVHISDETVRLVLKKTNLSLG